MEWMSMIKTHLGGDRGSEWNMARYLLAALHIQYSILDGDIA